MLLWQSSSAPPAGILACLQACIQGQVIVAGPVLAHNGESPFAPNRPRASSEDESVASMPLQETVFCPIGWSQCSHRTLQAFVLDVVVVRRHCHHPR
jgi:hypothetical protein